MTIQGRVHKGQQRGKRLGFPTMNVPLKISFPEGIYLSQTTINTKLYNSLTFIGEAKTFHETTYQSETYLLDFDQDIYGQEVQIELLKKIRDNQQFVSEEALIAQMEEDKRQAEVFFKNIKRDVA